MNEPSPLGWRKSSHSGSDVNTECVEVADLSPWRKSSHSGEDVNTECVEVADFSPVLAVRDSKNPGGPPLSFRRDEFGDLLARVKSGHLDL